MFDLALDKTSIFRGFLLLPILGLLLKDLIVSSDDFRLQPPTGEVWVWYHNSKLNLRFNENLNLFWLVFLKDPRGIQKVIVLLVWLNFMGLLTADLLFRTHDGDFAEMLLAFLLTHEEVPDRNVVFALNFNIILVALKLFLLVCGNQHFDMLWLGI